MSKNNNNTPRLRFPGFTEEWVEKKLGELLTYEQPTPYLVTDTNYKKSGIPVLTAGKTFILGYTDETHGVYDNLPVIIFDDFVTESKFVDFPFKVKSSAMKMLKLLDENNNLHLIYELMQLLQYPVKEHKRYWISEYSRLTIPLPPSPAEQQKIASCLSAMDDLIAAQAEKVEALKEKKTGLMQQLFPQPGETTPRLRFPGFTEEWKERKFSDCFEIGSGRDYKHLQQGEIPVYGSGGYMCSVNDYLYDGDSACIGRKGTINKPIFISGKFWTVDTLFYTYNYVETSAYFIYLLFQNIDWMKHNEAGGVPSLSKSIIYNISVYLPSPAEQQKIADCLSELDDLIASETKQLEALKDHKKGLMQQLFPQPAK